MIGKITRKQWEVMTPAQQSMWAMQNGVEPPRPKPERMNSRAERMQESLEEMTDALDRIREDQGGESPPMEQKTLPL